MENQLILVIEDDVHLSKIIYSFLKDVGYEVRQAYSGKDALEMAKILKPNLIILDIMLPEVDGIEICKTLRMTTNIPIIIISAKSSDYDKVLALGVGADDYLTKPFSNIELVARVKAHLRRLQEFSLNSNFPHTSNIKTIGALKINSLSYEVSVNGEIIDFSPKEFQLLDFLSSNPSQVFSKEQLIQNIWGYNEFIDLNTIAVYIGRVREKLAKKGILNIKTVWGVGYKWEKE